MSGLVGKYLLASNGFVQYETFGKIQRNSVGQYESIEANLSVSHFPALSLAVSQIWERQRRGRKEYRQLPIPFSVAVQSL